MPVPDRLAPGSAQDQRPGNRSDMSRHHQIRTKLVASILACRKADAILNAGQEVRNDLRRVGVDGT